MKNWSERYAPEVPGANEKVTVRMAGRADANALRRLAQLDSAPPPRLVPTLLAEVDGQVCAALSLDGGEPIADPFQPTAHLVEMLTARAEPLGERVAPRRRWRRALQLRRPRAAHA